MPKDFDKESFLKAGVSPSMFESSEKMVSFIRIVGVNRV